jgi:hypothetical protein
MCESLFALACLWIPQFDRTIPTARCDEGVGGVPRHKEYLLRVCHDGMSQGHSSPPRQDVPEDQGPIGGRRRQHVSLSGELQVPDFMRMVHKHLVRAVFGLHFKGHC